MPGKSVQRLQLEPAMNSDRGSRGAPDGERAVKRQTRGPDSDKRPSEWPRSVRPPGGDRKRDRSVRPPGGDRKRDRVRVPRFVPWIAAATSLACVACDRLREATDRETPPAPAEGPPRAPLPPATVEPGGEGRPGGVSVPEVVERATQSVVSVASTRTARIERPGATVRRSVHAAVLRARVSIRTR